MSPRHDTTLCRCIAISTVIRAHSSSPKPQWLEEEEWKNCRCHSCARPFPLVLDHRDTRTQAARAADTHASVILDPESDWMNCGSLADSQEQPCREDPSAIRTRMASDRRTGAEVASVVYFWEAAGTVQHPSIRCQWGTGRLLLPLYSCLAHHPHPLQ